MQANSTTYHPTVGNDDTGRNPGSMLRPLGAGDRQAGSAHACALCGRAYATMAPTGNTCPNGHFTPRGMYERHRAQARQRPPAQPAARGAPAGADHAALAEALAAAVARAERAEAQVARQRRRCRKLVHALRDQRRELGVLARMRDDHQAHASPAAAVLARADLTAATRIVAVKLAAELDSAAAAGRVEGGRVALTLGGAEAGYGLAAAAGCSARTASRALADLASRGLVDTHTSPAKATGGGEYRRYTYVLVRAGDERPGLTLLQNLAAAPALPKAAPSPRPLTTPPCGEREAHEHITTCAATGAQVSRRVVRPPRPAACPVRARPPGQNVAISSTTHPMRHFVAARVGGSPALHAAVAAELADRRRQLSTADAAGG